MSKYVYKILEDLIEVTNRTTMTPTKDTLFQVWEEELVEYLPGELAAVFHHVVAQLLFMSQCVCRDIQLTTSCLTQLVENGQG
jgi:hypothetical protein